jgi:uncharacterized protein with NAD-binding domain and iron-sulfur cluster
VAIIGGGCAGLAAAWHLSKRPDVEVSVYEASWRLGGKGASSRSAVDGRILEHGLHVWLGFYDNAFGMVRECYREVASRGWGPTAPEPADRLPHGSFEEAFFPEPHIGVTGRAAGEEVVWSGLLPPERGLPGDPIDADTNPFTVASYLLRCVHLLKTLMLSVIANPDDEVPGQTRPNTRSAVDQTIDLDFSIDPTQSPELLIQNVAGRLRDGTLTVAAALLQAVTIFESILQDLNHSPQVAGSILNLLKALAAQARKQLRDVVAIDPKLRWKTEIIDIVMTIAVGLYRDRVLLDEKGLDAINDLDYREWLLKHGATKTALESRFITGIYDLVFAYERGDRARPRLAAGVALRGALRMFFTYRGAMFWRMRSGMGDAVFAPLFKVLTRTDRTDPKTGAKLKPVRFHLLHRLTDLTFEVENNRRFVTGLRFEAANGGGRVENADDRALDHFGCWPETADPLLARVPGAGDPLVLKVQDDFDLVVFAVGLDEFSGLIGGPDGKKLRTGKWPAHWSEALASGQTVATKAAQMWLDQDLEGLGWYRGPGIIAALGLGFDTWADMTHTLSTERAWRNAKPSATTQQQSAGRTAPPIRSVAYFCGVLSDADIEKKRADEAAIGGSLATLLTGMSRVWPAAFRAPGRVKMILKHVQANVAPSDRYSLSLPGKLAHRISPLDADVLNMTIAGDWTASGLDAGCVEAAVISGMLAAHAITGGDPSLESIIGYDHP